MEYRDKIEHVKELYKSGYIQLSEAKSIVTPWLNNMNAMSRVNAKEQGGDFKPLTFGSIFN